MTASMVNSASHRQPRHVSMATHSRPGSEPTIVGDIWKFQQLGRVLPLGCPRMPILSSTLSRLQGLAILSLRRQQQACSLHRRQSKIKTQKAEDSVRRVLRVQLLRCLSRG